MEEAFSYKLPIKLHKVPPQKHIQIQAALV
jgi:hypothetical protein